MRRMPATNRLHERGMTLVEVIIVIAIIAIMVPVFAVVLIGSYRDSSHTNERVQLINQAMQGVRFMEDGVKAANSYVVAVPSPYADAYGPNNLGTSGAQAWSYKGNSSTSRVLILSSYATTEALLGTGRLPVYRSDGTFNCTTQKQYQPKLEFLTIFFVRNGTLYKRILNDRVSPLCAGEVQAQQESCPPEISAGSLDMSCQTRDEVLARNVVNFNVTYWQDTYLSQIDAYNSSDPTILDGADYITIDLGMSAYNGQVTHSVTERMTKLNR